MRGQQTPRRKTDPRRFAPATARNRDFILAVLQQHLPRRGLVLEIASGSGEHVAYFAQASGPELLFQPSDPSPAARASIDAWVAHLGIATVLPAIALDAADPLWPIAHADAVMCINMVHIAPWSATEGLLAGASRVLDPGGVLYLYGPYRCYGRHTAPSNERFDEELRHQNPDWGVRDVESVVALADAAGFKAPDIEIMPANNLSLIFHRRGNSNGAMTS